MTDLDALATAVILNEADMAAWGSFVDYCEENGLNLHPLALRSIVRQRWIGSNHQHWIGSKLQERIHDLSWVVNPPWRTYQAWDMAVAIVRIDWAIPLVNHVRNRPLDLSSA